MSLTTKNPLIAEIVNVDLKTPFGMCLDHEGNLIILDSGNHQVVKLTENEELEIIAGSGEEGFMNGSGKDAQFNFPTGICSDPEGNLYVADFKNHRIRKIDKTGEVSTLAGSGQIGAWDALGEEAKFNYPRGITMNQQGELFVADSWNHRIRKVNPDGLVSTFAGGGPVTDKTAGEENNSSFKDGIGFGVRLGTICGLSFDANNELYLADASNHRIRRISSEGRVETLIGNGIQGKSEGPALETQLNTPTDLFVHTNKEVFISDTYNDCIRMLDQQGILTTLDIREKDSRDTYQFNYPRGLAFDEKRDCLYIVDSNHGRLVVITSM